MSLEKREKQALRSTKLFFTLLVFWLDTPMIISKLISNYISEHSQFGPTALAYLTICPCMFMIETVFVLLQTTTFSGFLGSRNTLLM